MLHLYQSNKMEQLLAQLVRLLLSEHISPLTPQTVVVENPGLAHWLKMQLANSLGVAANIQFPMPSRFFWQLQKQFMADKHPNWGEESVFVKSSLRWLIFEALGDETLIQSDEFSLLARYLEIEGESRLSTEVSQAEISLRRMRLANTIADLYDQYLVYRPDWIQSWEQEIDELDGESFSQSKLSDHQWQPILWRWLVARAKEKGLPLQHRANLFSEFQITLAEDANTLASDNLPSSIIFFGFSTLPKHQLQTLELLSEKVDVHLLTPNPCEHYWGDVLDETLQARLRLRGYDMSLSDAGNDLLASLGQMGKDYQRLLIDVDGVSESSDFIPYDQHHVLGKIQNQILHLQQAKHDPQALEEDDSVMMVGCHSPLREIEVLHDRLVEVFSTTDLTPQDVVVMIPDVASYAPYIDAVFSQPILPPQQKGPRHIPYSISDRPVQSEHPVLAAFSHWLAIPQGRLAFSDVMEIFETPAVYQGYGLQEHDLPLIKDWLVQAGVRWGLDGESRAKAGLPQWEQNTWWYGFRRLLAGYAAGQQVLQTEDSGPWVGVDAIEGLDAALLGAVMLFVEDLQHFIEATWTARSPLDWHTTIQEHMMNWLKLPAEDAWILEHIHQVMDGWLSSAQAVHFNGAVAFSVVADALSQALQQSSGSQHFMVGKVNFCTLLPMRSIPFKMVAVLGLNDQDYPRSVTPNSLDLMRFNRRLGDRSRRDEDRYLFLEAIMSARQFLWLSYKSRDQKNDQPMTPSVVLAELMDYINDGFVEASGTASVIERLFQQHPLQPFNPVYYQKNSGFYSYNPHWFNAISGAKSKISGARDEAVTLESRAQTGQRDSDILLEDFIRFFEHPARDFLNQQLNIQLYQGVNHYQDEEPFELDGLTAYQLRQRLLQQATWSQSSDSGEATFKYLAEGHLAYGDLGENQWLAQMDKIQNVLSTWQEYLSEPEVAPLELRVDVVDEQQTQHKVLGWLREQRHDRWYSVQPGGFNGRQLVSLMVMQAVLSAMGQKMTVGLLTLDRHVRLLPMAMADARTYLETLMKWYLKGQEDPICFLPKTAWQLNLMKEFPETGEQALLDNKIQKSLFGQSSAFGLAGELDDLSIIRCFGQLDTFPQDTFELAKDMMKPWLDMGLFQEEAL